MELRYEDYQREKSDGRNSAIEFFFKHGRIQYNPIGSIAYQKGWNAYVSELEDEGAAKYSLEGNKVYYVRTG
jgi:hypothetical protein